MALQRRFYNSLPSYIKTDYNNLSSYVAEDVLFEPEQAQFINGYIGTVIINLIGDVNGNIISNLPSTNDIMVGMIVSGNNIQDGTLVQSIINTTTIIISLSASSIGNGISLSFSKFNNAQLAATPSIIENTDIQQKYQLSVAVAQQDPTTLKFISGAFYDDLLNHLSSNGAIITNPNLLFATDFYTWSPPIDYDKIINYAKYFWTGEGNSSLNGEYITKEAAGSQTTLYKFDGINLQPISVIIVDSLPISATIGSIYEDCSTTDRLLWIWNGSSWNNISYHVAVDKTISSSYQIGDYVYITMTGPNFNRPLFWIYRPNIGRWVSLPVIVNSVTPSNPSVGTIWEDSSGLPTRVFRIYDGTLWQSLSYSLLVNGPVGIPTSLEYGYDLRSISSVDGWSATNWWRALDDLSFGDLENPPTQALRPIIEFWGNIESGGASKVLRNQFPDFNLYAVASNYNIEAINPFNFPGLFITGQVISTIFQYSIQTTGVIDKILGFIPVYASDRTFQFELTLETQTITIDGNPLLGYRFFRDASTGYVYTIWEKSASQTTQVPDSNGIYDIPPNLIRNPDHIVLTTLSRSQFTENFASVISSQLNFSGNQAGNNNFRFTEKDLTLGATMIDPEESLLRVMAVLQTNNIDIPDAIRTMSREYNKIMIKFVNQLTNLWNNGTISTVENTLTFTPQQTVDVILTIIFNGRNSEFPFYYSVMGTYLVTRISGNIATVINPTPQPIYIPNSSAQIGAAPTYLPSIFTDIDSINKIRGHDGSVIPAFNDDRDLVILELENRFFNAVPSYTTQETSSYSSRYNPGLFFLADYYGNQSITATAGAVSNIVADYTTIISPITNERLYSKVTQVYVIWNGTVWIISNAQQGDIFFNQSDQKFYIFNGLYANPIPSFNNNFNFNYSEEQYRSIIQRDFERWVVMYDLDFMTNNQFDINNKFTWNYSSAGVEGNYKGIYRRCYSTVRPHSHPWEIAGYSIEPTWWQTSYVPTSIASDGTPRYANTHSMWNDLRNGKVNPITNLIEPARAMAAPIPVDINGNLIDPITSGMINESSLVLASLGDDWIYGDGGPVEDSFYNSYYYSFSVALAAYLMKTILFIDHTWSEYYRIIGNTGPNQTFNGPQIVYNTTLTRPQISQVPSQLSLTSTGTIVVNPGLNSWIAEYVRIIGQSPNVDFNEVIINSQAVLGWKCAGFINQKRTEIQLLNGDLIPSEDINVVLHEGPAINEYYQSGIMIVIDPDGYRVYGTDVLNPYFTVELGAKPISGGQIELTQTFVYNGSLRTFNLTQFTIPSTNDTAIFGVLINGYLIQSKFITFPTSTSFTIDPSIILNIGDTIIATLVTTISNPSTQLGTFVVEGQQFTYFMVGTGVYVNYPYGTLFTTITDVINMMVGYGRWLTSQGWIFERLTNGILRDWLGAAQTFVLWAIQTTAKFNNTSEAQGQIFQYSVMGRQTQFNSDFGNILGIEDIRNGSYGIVDVNNKPIRSNNINVVSTQGNITVSTDNTDIYGLRLYVSSIQHVVFFPNITTFNDLIYDPPLGLLQTVLYVSSYRTLNWNGRAEAPGFLISNGQLAPLSYGSTTPTPVGQLFPNWEKLTIDITKLYDRHNPVDDPILLGMARSLFGYVPKSYMTNIFADDRSQFNFFRGSRKTSGSIQPYLAFIKGTQIGIENVELSEDWAWKFSTYGDMRSVRVLFRVNTADFVDTRQVIHFARNCNTYTFLGDAVTSCFSIITDLSNNNSVVFVNNVLQISNIDYTIQQISSHTGQNGYEFCFNSIPPHNVIIEIIINCPYVNADQIIVFSSEISNTIALPTAIPTSNLFITWNGVYQTPFVDFTSSNEVVTFIDSPSSVVDTYIKGIGNCESGNIFDVQFFTPTLGQTTFVLAGQQQTLDTIVVIASGIWQTPSLDYTISGSDLIFSTPQSIYETIVVYTTINPNALRAKQYYFIGDGTTTIYDIANLDSYRQVIVNLNGIRQLGDIPGQSISNDYTVIDSNSTIIFNTPPPIGSIVTVYVIYNAVTIINDYTDDREIIIPEYTPPMADNRWLIPPPQIYYTGKPYGFPIVESEPCIDDIDYSYRYTAALVDYNTISNTPAQTLLHWNPLKGLHETVAYSLVDYKIPYDPARYNTGPLTEPYGLSWGKQQVGQVWWDTSTLLYENYLEFLPDFMRVSREWGSLLYYNATIVLNNEVVTVTTIDPKTQQVVSHGLITGQKVNITGADQSAYNGIITVTVSSPTTFTFIINTLADSPATGDIQVFIGLISCYEWVESPVPPSAWATYVASQSGFDIYTGIILNPSSPSYVVTEVWDVYGNSSYLYYFWVQNNTRIIPGKGMCVADIQGRLINPMNYEIPLFGIIEKHRMFVFTGVEIAGNGYAIEVAYWWNNQDKHIEWLLISQNGSSLLYPSLVTNKVIDSLLGYDNFNNPVPNVTLAPIEQLGTLNFPAQTIYKSRQQAISAFVIIMNTILANTDIGAIEGLLGLSLTDEYSNINQTGYWQRTTYFIEGINSGNVYDIVPELNTLNYNTSLGLYVANDIVEVLTSSGYFDPWTNDPVPAYFQYNGTSWILVGIDNHTAIINANIVNNTIIFRNFYSNLETQFSIQQVNNIIFYMLIEMVRQNPVCDWFFKTSYINAQTSAPLSMASFVGPDESGAIFDAITDLKPYRTKLRQQIAGYTYSEPMDVNIQETVLDKVTLLFDRLACDLNDENAWDTQGWDQSVVPFVNTISFIADGSTLCFQADELLDSNNIAVFVNGQIQSKQIYNIINNVSGVSEICFVTAPPTNSVIQIGFTAFAYQNLSELIGDGSTATVLLPNFPSTFTTDVITAWNGVYQYPTVDFNVSGNKLVFRVPPPIDVIAIVYAISGVSTNTFTVSNYIGDGATVEFSTNVPNGLTTNSVIVILDGIWQSAGSAFTVDNITDPSHTLISFSTVPELNTNILIYAINNTTLLSSISYATVGNNTTTEFSIPNYTINNADQVIVNINGVMQNSISSTNDYILDNGGIKFTIPPINGAIIDIFVINSIVAGLIEYTDEFGGLQWDYAFWDYLDLGRQEYDKVALVQCDGVTNSFTVPIVSGPPFLFNIKTELSKNGFVVDPTTVPVTISVIPSTNFITISLSATLSSSYQIAIYIARGLFDGPTPSFGSQDPNGIIWEPVAPSYQHYFARLISPTYDPSTQMNGCPYPEERVPVNLTDQFTIVVVTNTP